MFNKIATSFCIVLQCCSYNLGYNYAFPKTCGNYSFHFTQENSSESSVTVIYRRNIISVICSVHHTFWNNKYVLFSSCPKNSLNVSMSTLALSHMVYVYQHLSMLLKHLPMSFMFLNVIRYRVSHKKIVFRNFKRFIILDLSEGFKDSIKESMGLCSWITLSKTWTKVLPIVKTFI